MMNRKSITRQYIVILLFLAFMSADGEKMFAKWQIRHDNNYRLCFVTIVNNVYIVTNAGKSECNVRLHQTRSVPRSTWMSDQ
jgi:hypothetical protein